MQRRSTSQDISWFLDLKRNNQLDLNPPYQRRSVWNAKDRRFFLDTIFRGYPCPPIFLHKTIGEAQQAVYAVVDGKQRLQTLFMFTENEIALAADFGDIRYASKRWDEIEDKQVFWNYVVPVEFLIFDPNDPQEVNQAFDRLNRNMRKLEAQELRHARWDGWFIGVVENECEQPFWRTVGISTNARAKRMKDGQFISELLLVVIQGKQIGFDQQALDAAYARYDELDELDEEVDTDQVGERVAVAKEYLLEAQNTNGCIKQHASTLAGFYTVWALVILHRELLPAAPEFAVLCSEFFTKVKELQDLEDITPLINGNHGLKYRRAAEFLSGYQGASTDLAPRIKRLESMLAFLRGE
jgi:hypothetical protein